MNFKKWIQKGLAVAASFMMLVPSAAYAAEAPDPNQPLGLNVHFIDTDSESKTRTPVPGSSVEIFKVGELDEAGNPSLNEPYDSMDADAMAAELASKDAVDRTVSALSEDGKDAVASFPTEGKSLEKGVYLVTATDVVNPDGSRYEFSPYLVSLPGYDEKTDSWNYVPDSYPKNQFYAAEPETVSYKVTKKWDLSEGMETPKSVTVALKIKGEEGEEDQIVQTVELNEENGWTHEFKDLEKGPRYAIAETEVDGKSPSEEFSVSMSLDGSDVTITNSNKEVETDETEFKVTKYWDTEDDSEKGHSVKIALKIKGEEGQEDQVLETVELNDDNNWTHQFKDLEKGPRYSIAEVEVDGKSPEEAGYRVSMKQDGTDVAVTNTPKKTTDEPELPQNPSDRSIKVTKRWDVPDGVSTGKEVTVVLKRKGENGADDEILETVKLNADNNWTHEFTGLEKNVRYAVAETDVDGKTPSAAGYTVSMSNDNGDVSIVNTPESKKTNNPELPEGPNTSTNVTTNTTTNTKKTTTSTTLPYTGQHWIPVLVLLASGLACIVIGLIRRSSSKS